MKNAKKLLCGGQGRGHTRQRGQHVLKHRGKAGMRPGVGAEGEAFVKLWVLEVSSRRGGRGAVDQKEDSVTLSCSLPTWSWTLTTSRIQSQPCPAFWGQGLMSLESLVPGWPVLCSLLEPVWVPFSSVPSSQTHESLCVGGHSVFKPKGESR